MRKLLTGLVIAALLAVEAGAQGAAASPEALYQRALAAERGAGDLQGAIQLYRQVAAGSDRSLAARALVRLGEAYEKLGSREAQSAYERVVRDYADQSEPVSIARTRLAGLRSSTVAGATRAVPAPSLTLLYAELPQLRPRDLPQFDYSPAGDEIVLRRAESERDPLLGASLSIVNSGGTIVRTIVPARRETGIVSPRWSPDGQHIAFIRRAWVGSDTSFHDLMLIPAAGGEPRKLLSDPALGIPNAARGGVFWTPDSKGVTVSTAKGLLTVDLEGNVVRTAPMEVRYLQHVIGYSPDGRWIVYDRTNQDSEQDDETDIWLMPSGGGERIQLTTAPGLDSWPAWGPDSRTVYFVSDRSGDANVWRLEIDPATGRPASEPVQVTHYTDARILYPRVVDGGRRLTFAMVREMSAVHVGSPDDIKGTRAVARGVQPVLSPDGQTVYYLSQGEQPPGIFAAPVSGGRPRRLTTGKPGGAFFQPFALSRDGSALAYFVRDGNQTVMYTAPTGGGNPVELIRLDGKEHLVPAWSADGTRLAYAHKGGLYVIPASGGSPQKLAAIKGIDGWSLRYSPDGSHIALLGWPENGKPDENAVYVIPASGGDLRKVTSSDEQPGYKEGLEWHPDGTRLSYMYHGHDWRGDETHVVYMDGRPATKLVDQPYPVWDYVGKWSPDGRTYYLISSNRGGWGLYAHDVASSATREVWAEANGSANVPEFSADGRTIVFPVLRTTRQLWAMDLIR